MFTYNFNCNNKNIPFKKILKKGIKKNPDNLNSELGDKTNQIENTQKDENGENMHNDMTLPLNTTNIMTLNQGGYKTNGNISLLGDASFLDMVQIKDNLINNNGVPEITMKSLNNFKIINLIIFN